MIEFNLVPKNLRNRSRTAINWLRVGTIFGIAVTLVAISASVANQMSLGIYRRELNALRPGIQRVDELERQLRDVRRENQRLSGEIDRLGSLGDGGQTGQFLSFLSDLSTTSTDGILLELLEYSRGGNVRLSGVAINPEELSRFFERVKQIQGVREASLTQMGRPAGDRSTLRGFELRIQWRAGG